MFRVFTARGRISKGVSMQHKGDGRRLTWEILGPQFDALLHQPLTPASVQPWLRRWSDLEKQVWEARAWLKRAKSWNMAGPEVHAAFQRFTAEVFGPFEVAGQKLKTRLLELDGWSPPPEQHEMLRVMRSEAALFHEANVALNAEIGALSAEYEQREAARRVAVNGVELLPPEVARRASNPERPVREKLWRAQQVLWAEWREDVGPIFLEQLRLRRRLAGNAGLPDYRAYRWRELNRLDYTPDDCLRLHAALEAEIVPLGARLRVARRERLGLDTLRPWDLEAPRQEHPLLNPFRDPDEFASRMAGVYAALDPDLGAMFERMRDGFLDLGVRKGKASGSEEWVFPVTELTYVRVGTNGTFDDLLLLLHESGHAFHDYMALKHNALIWDLYYPTEFSEFAAIAMSHLGLQQIERGGIGASVDVAGARRAFLAGVVVKWLPQIALVDAFQHWLYAEAPPDVDTAALDRKWAELSTRFIPGVDWSGLERELGSGWQQVGLLFGMPFYYIEYALAHLSALEVWQSARRDWSNAWHRYRSALALGATRSLPELFRVAGTRLPFDREVVRDAAALLAAELQAYPD